MDTQVDYEAIVHLAVFRSGQSAETAARALRQAGIEYSSGPLLPGHYQVADRRLSRYTRLVVGAAIVGAVIGAIVGVVLALRSAGVVWPVVTWFGVAGAACGAVIGGLIGLEARAHYDADVARSVEVAAQPAAVLITTHTTQASPNHRHVQDILRNAGAVAFLDVPSYETRQRESERTIVEATSAGGR